MTDFEARVQIGLDRHNRWPKNWFRIQEFQMGVTVNGRRSVERVICLRHGGYMVKL